MHLSHYVVCLSFAAAAAASLLLLPLLACRYDFADWLSSRVNMQLSNEAGQSQVMADVDVKGKDWNGQVKLGTPQFLGECSGLAVCSLTGPRGRNYFIAC
jgi:hypothetical protein